MQMTVRCRKNAFDGPGACVVIEQNPVSGSKEPLNKSLSFSPFDWSGDAMKQTSFASLAFDAKKKQTRREGPGDALGGAVGAH
jgi:hypothetical protein